MLIIKNLFRIDCEIVLESTCYAFLTRKTLQDYTKFEETFFVSLYYARSRHNHYIFYFNLINNHTQRGDGIVISCKD